MNREDAEEFTQALEQIHSGGWRMVAVAQRQGVPAALGLTTEEWVMGRLGGYIRLGIPERREAVAELVEEGMSNVAIGDVLGVGEATIRRDRSSDDESGDTSPGANGKSRRSDSPNDEARTAALPDDLAERVQAETLTLDDAEVIVEQNRERMDAYAESIAEALGVLSRMAGYPIPVAITERLSDDDNALLNALLVAITQRKVAA